MDSQSFPGSTNPQKKGLPWAIIIVVLIVFWPVGIYLVYRKLTNDKQAALKTGKVINIIGWVLLVMGIFAVITGPEDKSQAVSGRIEYFFLFVCSGLAMVLLGARSKRRADRFKKYIAIIINQNMSSIENIAASFPIDYKTAAKDLQKMIDIGYFEGAYIDNVNREIVLNSDKSNNYAASNFTQTEKAPGQLQVVRCKNCGANNQVSVGQLGECEYCGSPISTDQ